MEANGNGRLGPDIIETTDEEGNVHFFEKVDDFEVEGQRYALLIYQGGEEEEEQDEERGGYDEELLVMRIIKDGPDDVYEAIDDDTEFERVVKYIEEMSEDGEEEDELFGSDN